MKFTFKPFITLFFIVSCLMFFLSCKEKKQEEPEPIGEYFKFKVDGKQVSQADVKGEFDLRIKGWEDEYSGNRLVVELFGQDADTYLWFEFHSKEKYVINKEYKPVDPATDDLWSTTRFSFMKDGKLTDKSIYILNGATLILTEYSAERVKGRFTVNANPKKDPNMPSVTEGSFSVDRF